MPPMRIFSPFPPKETVRNIGEVKHDLFELGRLQWELLLSNARQFARSLLVTGVALLVALALIVAVTPLLLVALAVGMVHWTVLELPATLAIVAAGGGLIGALIV